METYATDDVIAKTETEMQRSKMSSIMTPNDYTEALWTNVRRRSQVSTEYTFKDIFVEGLPYPIAIVCGFVEALTSL